MDKLIKAQKIAPIELDEESTKPIKFDMREKLQLTLQKTSKKAQSPHAETDSPYKQQDIFY